jgi:hypothetical protein
MANSSTPRLKVYRLNENYVQSGDNDVQPMTNDEMLPIVPKNISPFNAEPMVGVRARQDGRIVVESDEWNVVALEVEMMSGAYVQTKTPICCEGWVLGKGNMEVCVYKGKGTASELTPPSGIEVNGGDFSDYPDNSGTSTSQWIPIDRKFWDYSVESKKTYCVPSDGSPSETPSAPSTSLGLATYFDGFSSDVVYGDNGIGGSLSALYKNGWYSRLQLAKPSNDVNYEVHDMDWITFTIGKMLFMGDRFFKNGYENYVPVALEGGSDSGSPSGIVVSGRILVRYKKYCEVGTAFSGSNNKFNGVKTDEFTGIDKKKCRVPFGDIYNGNRNGRALSVVGSDTRVNLVEEGTEAVDPGRQSFYEGNYLYRRKIYPLRVKVIQDAGVASEFIGDAAMDGMRAEVPCELSWFMDDVMKPVVFERITVDEGTPDERKIFKQLTKKQVTVAYQNSNDNDVYVVTLNSVYYETARRSPRELFLVYNYVDDSLGDIFDFDYDYIRTTTNPNVPCFMKKSAEVGYGYANDGRLATDDYDHDSSLTVQGIDGYVYLKRTVLAVRKDSGSYDGTRDIPIDNPNGSTKISFVLSGDSFTTDGSDSASVQNEKKRINDGLNAICVDANHILNVYVDGTRLCSIDGVTTTVENVNIGGDNNYSVSYDTSSRTMTIAHPDQNKVAELVEVMVSYYEQHPISFKKSGGNNPYCIGYRVPCYEKEKASTLFVSSFPNWVKGHVNNDLDVFVGNKLYSGTELKGGNLEEYHNIYPQYVKDGWYAMYHDGAVEFNEPQEEINYFDMLNYGGEITNGISTTSNAGSSTDGWNYVSSPDWRTPDYWVDAKKLSLAVRKVKYNVAHYDGIYSVIRGRMCNYSNKGEMYRYALLEDDDNYGSRNKRLVGRSDSSIRRMMESGRDEMPKLISNVSTADFPMEELHDIKFDAGNRYALVNTKNDRVTTFAIPSGLDYVVMCFGAEPTDAGLVGEGDIKSNWVKVYAKVQNGELFFSTDGSSWNSGHEYADIPDVITGTLSDNNDNYLLDKDLSEIQGGMAAFSPKDATSGSSWTYDVYFEPFSYRKEGNTVTYVEVVAYRKMKI